MSDDGIRIAAAVESLRHELTGAIETGNTSGERMRFRLDDSVVLELQAVVSKVGQGKLGWKIVEVGGSYTLADTHKVILKLKPEWWDGTKYTTDFRISASLPSSTATPSDEATEGHATDSDELGALANQARRLSIDDGIEDD